MWRWGKDLTWKTYLYTGTIIAMEWTGLSAQSPVGSKNAQEVRRWLMGTAVWSQSSAWIKILAHIKSQAWSTGTVIQCCGGTQEDDWGMLMPPSFRFTEGERLSIKGIKQSGIQQGTSSGLHTLVNALHTLIIITHTINCKSSIWSLKFIFKKVMQD